VSHMPQRGPRMESRSGNAHQQRRG